MRLAPGLKVGKVTLGARTPDGKWNCVCACGSNCIKSTSALHQWKRGALSCGCEMYQYLPGNKSYKWKGFGDISAHLWKRYKSNASTRGIIFSISMREAWNMFENQGRNCALTGIPLVFGTQYSSRNSTTASLDRIDTKLGYTIANTRWVHKIINTAKWDYSDEEFLRYCTLLLAPLVSESRSSSCDPQPHHKNWGGWGNLSGDKFGNIRRGAKARNIEFKLSGAYTWDLFIAQKGRCALTGLTLAMNTLDHSGSLDRIDNNIGYVSGNVRWIHKDMNSIKGSLTDAELRLWAGRVVAYRSQSCE